MMPIELPMENPKAKSVKSACRNLFGKSDPTAVEILKIEMMTEQRKKALSRWNIDVTNEKPLVNVKKFDETPSRPHRYQWKPISGEKVPEFYSQRYKGRKALMPFDLSHLDNCDSVSNTYKRPRTARRSLNGYLRTVSNVPLVKPQPISLSGTSVPLDVLSEYKSRRSLTTGNYACSNDENRKKSRKALTFDSFANGKSPMTKVTAKITDCTTCTPRIIPERICLANTPAEASETLNTLPASEDRTSSTLRVQNLPTVETAKSPCPGSMHTSAPTAMSEQSSSKHIPSSRKRQLKITGKELHTSTRINIIEGSLNCTLIIS